MWRALAVVSLSLPQPGGAPCQTQWRNWKLVQWYFTTKATPIAQSIGINELCQPFFYLYISESERPTWEQSDGLCLEPTTPDPSSILCLEKNIMVRFEIITKCHEVEESDFNWWLPMSMLTKCIVDTVLYRQLQFYFQSGFLLSRSIHPDHLSEPPMSITPVLMDWCDYSCNRWLNWFFSEAFD